MLHAVGRTEFDHAVIMVRDQLDALSPHFQRQGFTLSDVSTHNLGSCNRLIALEDTYVELLGWPPGAPPARKEIADSPLGLEALVFRTYDAQATYQRLLDEGFAVNPVQDLSRPAKLGDGMVQARFHTVRFAEQPVPGIRMYFCRHLTPECVWVPELMAHPNGARRILRIEARAADAKQVAVRLGRVVDVPVDAVDEGWKLGLGNLDLLVIRDDAAVAPRLSSLILENRDGARYTLDTGV